MLSALDKWACMHARVCARVGRKEGQKINKDYDDNDYLKEGASSCRKEDMTWHICEQ